MDKIVIGAELRKKLDHPLGTAELCDEAGNIVALAIRTDVYERLVLDWAKAEFDREDRESPDEEDDSIEGTYTTAEVLEHLAQIERDASGAA